MDYREEVLADGPTIYLPFTGSSLTTNLGSRTGVSVISSQNLWGAGRLDEAPRFRGINFADRVNYNLNPHNVLNSTAWTVEIWFKRSEQMDHMDLINSENTANQLAVMQWAPGETTDDRKIIVFYKAAGGSKLSITGPKVTDDDWHHVAVVRSGTTVTLYVDGAPAGALSGTGTMNFTSTSPFRLGAYGDSANNENYSGWLDEFAIYTKVLSPERITAHYRAGMAFFTGWGLPI